MSWYITYKAVGQSSSFESTNKECHMVTDENPVDFAIRSSKAYDDGPYVVIFAMELTVEQREKYKGYQD